MPKVSVIVPIYNIDSYIDRCVNSLINQTIFEEMEILLINDGSTDESCRICEKYSRDYPNVILINKENEGVSSARNCGIEAAKGEYLGFVDGDDYVETWFFEKMVDEIEASQSDMVVFDYFLSFEDGKRKSYRNSKKTIEWSADTLLRDFLKGYMVGQNLFDKLFVTSYVKQIRFDTNIRIGEDLLFLFHYLRLISSAKGCFVPGYYYVQRTDSAMNRKFDQRYFDIIKVSNQILLWAKENPDYYEYAYAQYIHNAYKTVERIYKSKSGSVYENEIRELVTDIKTYRLSKAKKNLSGKQFAGFCLMRLSPRLYLMVVNLLRI